MRRGRRTRALILLLGLLASQLVSLWPALIGGKVLLPLDLLGQPEMYLPRTPGSRPIEPRNVLVSDLVLVIYPTAELARDELRDGSLPLWNPYSFCGAPLLGGATASVFSPFNLLHLAFDADSPRALAWVQLARALATACGAYLFFRRALHTRFWPAAVGAWCWPHCGFLMLTSGFPVAEVVMWLPWMLLSIDALVRRPAGFGGVGLALTTAAALYAGHPGTAAQVLVAGGVWFIARAIDHVGWRALACAAMARRCAVAALAVALGVALSAPQSLPTLEYLGFSLRVAERTAGHVDIAPYGLKALPQLVLPFFHGSNLSQHVWLVHGNQLEGAPAGYAGLLLALVLAPLALASRRRLRWFWLIGALAFAGQVLDLPLMTKLAQLPPFVALQNNRFVFFTGWCTLALGIAGLDELWRRRARWKLAHGLAVGALVVLGIWSAWRAVEPPQLLQSWMQTQSTPAAGSERVNPERLARVERVRKGFERTYWSYAALCATALAVWGALALTRARRAWLAPAVAALVVGESLAFARDLLPQSDARLFFPPLPALEQLARIVGTERVCGIDCLPATLNLSHGLRDVRGYDGIDPAPIVRLLDLCRRENSPRLAYATTQWFMPEHFKGEPEPVLDALAVRYFIYRGKPPPGVATVAVAEDYWVIERPSALERVYVPRRVEVAADDERCLALLASATFSPSDVVYVDAPPSAPIEAASGSASIVEDRATHVAIDARMQTPGLLVLADAYFPGWKAYRDGVEVPVLRANHALRAIELPAGEWRVDFRYEPASFAIGVWIGAIALVLLGVWAVLARGRRHSCGAG